MRTAVVSLTAGGRNHAPSVGTRQRYTTGRIAWRMGSVTNLNSTLHVRTVPGGFRFKPLGRAPLASSSQDLPHLDFYEKKPQIDVFEILGISHKASADEIKAAYRNKAKELHPDVNSESDANQKFLELQKAYKILVNEWKMVLERVPGGDSTEHKDYNEKINKEMLDMFNSSFTEPY